jgi:ABC-2 type transport system permease protein
MTATAAHSAHLAGRSVRAFARQPWYVAVTLFQPVVWLLLFGQLFKGVTQLPGFGGVSYIGYLTPGVIVMTAMFSSGWSGMSLIIEMERGVLDRFLVSPIRPGALILAGMAYQTLVTLIQSAIILALGLAAGARFPGGAASMAAFLCCVVLLAAAFASFSNAVALRVRRQESVIGVVNFLVLPLSFLSTTFMPAALVPSWIRTLARVNPVNWTVEVGRQTLHPVVDWTLVGQRTVLLALLAAALAWVSTRAFAAYRRSM